MSDRENELINEAQHGDIDCFEALIRPYQSRLLRFIVTLTGNPEDAEDSLQETLLQAYRALPQFRGEASFSTWLHRVALNTARNWLRSQSRASSLRISERLAMVGAEAPAFEDVLLARESRRLVRQALWSLPTHYREVLIMRHYEEMAYEDIADILQVPIGTIRSRLAQGRHLLQKKLDAQGFFPTSDGR